MKSLLFNLLISCCCVLYKSKKLSESSLKDENREVFINQVIRENQSLPVQDYQNEGFPESSLKDGERSVFINQVIRENQSLPGQEHLNKGELGQIYANKTSQAKKSTLFESESESRGESSVGKSICKCGVGRRFKRKEIRKRKRLLRHRMVDRSPFSSSLPSPP